MQPNTDSAWWQSNLKRHGSVEAVREFYRDLAKKNHHKAVLKRLDRIETAFKAKNKRPPTITELNDLYKEEMRNNIKKASKNPNFHKRGNWKLARENPEELSRRMSELAKKRWSKDEA